MSANVKYLQDKDLENLVGGAVAGGGDRTGFNQPKTCLQAVVASIEKDIVRLLAAVGIKVNLYQDGPSKLK